jgi:hypothetical protein
MKKSFISSSRRSRSRKKPKTVWYNSGHELTSATLMAPAGRELTSFESFSRGPAMSQIRDYIEAIRGKPADPWWAYANHSSVFTFTLHKKLTLEVTMWACLSPSCSIWLICSVSTKNQSTDYIPQNEERRVTKTENEFNP